nr:hypothetical protein [Tanacetum cinerariifolium]
VPLGAGRAAAESALALRDCQTSPCGKSGIPAHRETASPAPPRRAAASRAATGSSPAESRRADWPEGRASGFRARRC